MVGRDHECVSARGPTATSVSFVVSWDPSAELENPVDFRLAMNGPVTLFWNTEHLAKSVRWLRSHGYRVVEVDASTSSRSELLVEVGAGLGFPHYFGRSLDAFHDCLGDVASGEYGWEPTDAGLVLVLTGFDSFVRAEPHAAHGILDSFTEQGRFAMLFGNRLLCLAQTDDPGLSLPPVGTEQISWNDAESLASSRG